jgi:ribosomal protein S18 acetylase RimI-like enzyme
MSGRRNPTEGSMEIRRAGPADLEMVVPLFDAYRRFYGQVSDLPRARAFLAERLERGDSVIFLALEHAAAVGFTQLYPLFSSLSCRPLWLLNDLFVVPEARRLGVARALADAARDHAVESGACGIELATAHSNVQAQRLYESLGYRVDDEFRHYELRV